MGAAAAWLVVVAVPAGAVTPVVEPSPTSSPEPSVAADADVPLVVAEELAAVADGPALEVPRSVDGEVGAELQVTEWDGLDVAAGVVEVDPPTADDAVEGSGEGLELRSVPAGELLDMLPGAADAALGLLGRAGVVEAAVPDTEPGTRVRVGPVDAHGVIPGAAVALTLEHDGGAKGASWAELVLDPRDVEGAFGGDFASRLEWANMAGLPMIGRR